VDLRGGAATGPTLRGRWCGGASCGFIATMTEAASVVDAWPWSDPVTLRSLEEGLIHRSWVVDGGEGPTAVLQRVNLDIFSPRATENIDAVTSRLAACGMRTPRVLRTRRGALWHTDEHGGCWRALSFVGDQTATALGSAAQAEQVGRLVARFHAALADFDWEFRPIWSEALRAGGTRDRFHDTAAYMGLLEIALEEHPGHRLRQGVTPVAQEILAAWGRWDGPARLPLRVVHGDLKLSNVRFSRGAAEALIDLDTVGPGTIDAELGDALRSWCNTATEDSGAPVFDIELFEAAMRGYARGGELSEDEWSSVVPGVERIALELAGRFARDALEESYFGWEQRFGGRGEHNLLRARGQLALAGEVRSLRGALEAAVGRARAVTGSSS
jgi:Ser/Thr protein kinase RdoA (MazF antagonist)